jgi:hypothetical protein
MMCTAVVYLQLPNSLYLPKTQGDDDDESDNEETQKSELSAHVLELVQKLLESRDGSTDGIVMEVLQKLSEDENIILTLDDTDVQGIGKRSHNEVLDKACSLL